MINESLNKIVRTYPVETNKVETFTAYSNVSGQEFKSYSFNQTKKPKAFEEDELDF